MEHSYWASVRVYREPDSGYRYVVDELACGPAGGNHQYVVPALTAAEHVALQHAIEREIHLPMRSPSLGLSVLFGASAWDLVREVQP